MLELPNLPASNDKFWDGNKQTITPQEKKCNHEFIRRTGKEVICKFCSVGFILSANSTLKDKHIYINNKFVI